MANSILSHVNENSYRISFSNLEDIHSKIMQSNAVLSLLGEWICESESSFYSQESRDKLMQVLFLLIDLIQDTRQLLPEV
jgi:hypothetical protein